MATRTQCSHRSLRFFSSSSRLCRASARESHAASPPDQCHGSPERKPCYNLHSDLSPTRQTQHDSVRLMPMTLIPSPRTSSCLCVRPELLTEDGCWVLCPANNYCFDGPEYPWDDENYPEGTIPADGPTYQKRCPGVSVSPPRSTSLADCVCPVPPPTPTPHILPHPPPVCMSGGDVLHPHAGGTIGSALAGCVPQRNTHT